MNQILHTGHFAREFVTAINNASIIRNHSDYDDFYICSKEETEELIYDAERFVIAITVFLKKEGCQTGGKQ